MQYIHEVSESDAQTSYPVSRILYEGSSQWCESIVVAESPLYGTMLFLDGEIQSAEADEHIYHESLVHVAMTGATSVYQKPLSVLVIGGGEGATVREVNRWNPARVDWVDIDPTLVRICDQFLQWAEIDHHQVRYYSEDIREYWTHCDMQYDVIVIDLPDPDGETGYLYSPAFWDDVRAHLTEGGRFVTHVGPVRPYRGIGEGAKRIVETTREAGIQLSQLGFYHIGIPSFQGDWGFWCWINDSSVTKYPEESKYPEDGTDPFHFPNPVAIPHDLRVVDETQMRIWAHPSGMWRRELARLISL